VPGISSARLKEEHVARYEFAAGQGNLGAVLDVACGTGYGSHHLAGKADTVVGVDVSDEAIGYAKEHYSAPNLAFVKADCTALPFAAGSYDTVVSFETIEHLEKDARAKFLGEIKRVLKRDGRLLLSTPNKAVTSPDSAKPLNKFHVIEFDRAALDAELAPYFRLEKRYGQRFIPERMLNIWVRRAVRIVEKISGMGLGIYTTKPAAAVTEWKERRQPRILLVDCKPNE